MQPSKSSNQKSEHENQVFERDPNHETRVSDLLIQYGNRTSENSTLSGLPQPPRKVSVTMINNESTIQVNN